jgi:acetyl-CoA acetyltransferase
MSRHPLRGATAITGLGLTPQGKVYGQNAIGFAVDAVQAAVEDAGLQRSDLDGCS